MREFINKWNAKRRVRGPESEDGEYESEEDEGGEDEVGEDEGREDESDKDEMSGYEETNIGDRVGELEDKVDEDEGSMEDNQHEDNNSEGEIIQKEKLSISKGTLHKWMNVRTRS